MNGRNEIPWKYMPTYTKSTDDSFLFFSFLLKVSTLILAPKVPHPSVTIKGSISACFSGGRRFTALTINPLISFPKDDFDYSNIKESTFHPFHQHQSLSKANWFKSGSCTCTDLPRYNLLFLYFFSTVLIFLLLLFFVIYEPLFLI